MPDRVAGAGHLLERERECAVLERTLEAAAGGEGGLVVIEGRAGLGKSRLVRWSLGRAGDLGLTVLAARSGALEHEFAFGVVLQLFGPWLARASGDERARVLAGAAEFAAPLFDPSGWSPGGPPEAEHGLLHGLHWLAANIAEHRPLLICVDDVHWADQPSLRFLRYVTQRIAELPLSLLVASRPLSAGAGGGLLGGLTAHPLARRLELRPLSRAATAGLARDGLTDVDESFCDALWEVTGGNPLFVHELLHAVRNGDIGTRADELARLAQVVPRSVSQHVLVRIARLGGPARALAGAVAVLGDGTPLRRAAELSGLDGDVAALAADALVAEEIVTIEDGERLAFEHPLVRDAVHADLPQAQRGRAHLRAAQMLAAETAEPGEVAVHLLAAPVAGEPWVAETLAHSAAWARERGSPEHSVRYLRRALAEPLEPLHRAQLLVDLARAEVMVGDPQAPGHLDEAIAVLEAPRDRARALAVLGRALEGQGRHADAAAAFERALAELPDAEDLLARELSVAYAGAASVVLAPQAFARIQRVLERPSGSETTGELSVLAALAVQRTIAGEPRPVVLELARRAWADGRLLREEGWGGRSWSLLTGALYWNDEFALGEEIAAQALEIARRAGSVVAYGDASYCLSLPVHARGRLAEALGHAQQALEARRDGWQTFLLACVWQAASVHLDRDELDLAEEVLRVLDEPGGAASDASSVERAFALDARGQLRLLQDRPREALDDHLAAGGILGAAIRSPAILPWRSGAALAAHRLGDARLALDLAASELELARPTEIPRAIATPLRAAGLIQGGSAGLEMLREAIELLDEIDAPVEQARSLLALGSTLRRSGERVRAREPLRGALHLAHRCGASLLVSLAQEELRAAGARPRRIVLTGVDSLTPSERRVADMASRGMTNRDIAQALFVTVHAIDKHLRGTYEKLGIGSRRELAAELVADVRG